ncbi:MAG: hypothetical protein AABZ47_11035 [Planctomycetota bacterium]
MIHSALEKPETPSSLWVESERTPRVGRLSERMSELGVRFGIPLYTTSRVVLRRTKINLSPGRLIAIVGPSGSGKSTAIGEIGKAISRASLVQHIKFPLDTAVIDAVAPGAELNEVIALLTSAGLGEPHLWIRPVTELSEGERFRAQLARAIALQHRAGGGAPLLCDEFCSNLHRRLAKAVSYNLRKLVTRRGICAVVAINNPDILDDLQPDTIVHLKGNGAVETEEVAREISAPFSLLHRVRIERGCKRDFEPFAGMHYRATNELGFVDKVFVLRDIVEEELLGIVVYSHGPLENSLRNAATNGRFVRDPEGVNRHFRIVRRLVIHPDVRGCGLGHYLLSQTLPRIGTKYVECLASMGEFNPVFEKAGMRRIGQYELAADRQAALNELASMDVDPNGPDFALQVAQNRRVRATVTKTVHDWYAATTGSGQSRVERQSPQLLSQTFRGLIGLRPVYYLWQRPSLSETNRSDSGLTRPVGLVSPSLMNQGELPQKPFTPPATEWADSSATLKDLGSATPSKTRKRVGMTSSKRHSPTGDSSARPGRHGKKNKHDPRGRR